ncbi:hypothetical protein TNCV_4927571 [Trichonephila clavipes]|nr:hypothetical protein TNCV_4927571 [Trichonephila clavipes]
MKQPLHVKGVQYAQHAHVDLKQPKQHPTMCVCAAQNSSLLMCGRVSSGRAYLVHSLTASTDSTSISSFCKRYFQHCLPMSLHMFGAETGQGPHLIMECVYVTIWTEHFQTGALGLAVPSLGPSRPPESPFLALYLSEFFSLKCHEEFCVRQARQF